MKYSVDPIKLIFGLKLKQFRIEKALSLKELSNLSGLSASYLNEIEKGKKYPNHDKILALSEALEVEFDRLVSTDLDSALGPIGELLRSSFFKDIPFEFFGIHPGNVIETIANAPVRFSAFVNTLIKMGRSYNLSVESFYFAVLRSFLEIHKNYFPELEKQSEAFLPEEEKSEANLIRYLKTHHKIRIEEFDPAEHPEIASLRSVWMSKRKTFYINKNLSKDQRRFTLAKEVGFRYLGLKERPDTSTWVEVNSFDEVFNNFKASYFASAILINKDLLIKSLSNFFSQKSFSARRFKTLLNAYGASSETIFYRMFTVLPQYFDIGKIYFLKFEMQKDDRADLVKEIHLTGQHDPQENRNEHYCRRWPGLSIFNDLSSKNPEIILPQISEFENNGHRYFDITLGKINQSGKKESITLGFEINQKSLDKVKFIHDPKVTEKRVGQTCERCGIFDCKERVAAPISLYNQRKKQEILEAIEKL